MACTSSSYECPVCHEDYVDPKILPCGHLVCQKCVVAWLDKEGRRATCPLCRASILPSDGSDGVDPVSTVEALPTDLHTAALVESHQILQGPHICSLCEDDVAACSYCVQCGMKLCTHCAKGHGKIPATSAHTLVDLDNLSVEKLAETCPVICKVHPDRLAELYCPAHQEVICILCGTTSHGSCANRQAVTDVVTDVRAELKQQVQKLRLRETELACQIRYTKDHFKTQRKKVQDLFDDLHNTLEVQRQMFNNQIQAEEESDTVSVAALENQRAILMQNATMLGRLVQAASTGALLQMHGMLRQRVEDLGDPATEERRKASLAGFLVDEERLDCLRTDLTLLGHVHKPTGPEVAQLLRVENRVKRGQDWCWGNQDGDPPGLGTVRQIDTYSKMVFVAWDCGEWGWYRMGMENLYELSLVA